MPTLGTRPRGILRLMDHADGHRYFEGLAVAHVLGGLDDSEGRVFRSHLLECGTCRARVGELRAIAHDLADVERDERRVRAAQAIDTKRRESEDEVAEAVDPVPSPRSSRITILVGLVLIIGLSLWNFTLRGALTIQEAHNRSLVNAGVVSDTGQRWTSLRTSPEIQGSAYHKGDELVVTVDGLNPEQAYGLYLHTADGTVAFSYAVIQPSNGRLYRLLNLRDDVVTVTLWNPEDADGRLGEPGEKPSGENIFEVRKP